MSWFNFTKSVLYRLGWDLRRDNPRPSTLFAKSYFSGKPIVAIEVGVYTGNNLKSILKELNIQKVYAIDSYQISEGDINEQLPIKPEQAKEIFLKILNKPNSQRIKFINEDSLGALRRIQEKADFIYIDGSHRAEDVRKDLVAYYNLLKDGGILAGHDMNMFDVAKEVVAFCKKKKIKATFDFPDWYIVKKTERGER